MDSIIYTLITDHLAEIGLVNPTTGVGAPPPLPATQVWLAEDKTESDRPESLRAQVWACQLTVAHSETPGEAQAKMLEMVGKVRSGFTGWRPTGVVGIHGGFSVPLIKIEGFSERGNLVYLCALSIRVSPKTFKVE